MKFHQHVVDYTKDIFFCVILTAVGAKIISEDYFEPLMPCLSSGIGFLIIIVSFVAAALVLWGKIQDMEKLHFAVKFPTAIALALAWFSMFIVLVEFQLSNLFG